MNAVETLGNGADASRDPLHPLNPLHQNLESIAILHEHAERGISRHQRMVEKVTGNIGRPAFFYFILLLVAAWTLLNVFAHHLGFRPWDPAPFYWLQGSLSFCSLLVTVMVLITQNRQGKQAQRREHLELQVNLLAEQKVTKLIELLDELRRDLPMVQDRRDPEVEALKEPTNPEDVLAAVDAALDDAVRVTAADLAADPSR